MSQHICNSKSFFASVCIHQIHQAIEHYLTEHSTETSYFIHHYLKPTKSIGQTTITGMIEVNTIEKFDLLSHTIPIKPFTISIQLLTGKMITTSLYKRIELFEIIKEKNIFELYVKLGIQNKIYITPKTIKYSDLQRISKEIIYESVSKDSELKSLEEQFNNFDNNEINEVMDLSINYQELFKSNHS